MSSYRWLIALAAIATSLVLVAADADARVGGGSSAGSRGTRTFSAPAPTRTAPNTAAPIQRSVTQPGSTTTAAGQATRPGLLGGGLFGGGLLGGLAAGFIGAGLFGLLFGHGMFGGMGGFASILGLLLQVALVVIVARLLFAWWQRRNAPQEAYAAAHPATGHAFGGLGAMLGGGNAAPAGEPVTIAKSDYDAYEQLLGDVQAAYSAEDLAALRAKVTPEMLSYFSEQLSENASRGLINRVTAVKLEQGDLAEAWREGDVDYATVAMRFALTDSMVERSSGRTVEGGSPSEATELWTFMRARGGNWLVSAIQQS
ncbi:MAG: TIM44-like domain-containing protein [Rhizobiales bacterium]|nr:TIM44-like domain-containing protein [Hyphomicrobiales bacterium]